MEVEEARTGKSLGGGRSGEVFLLREEGREVARKVFSGDRLARLLHYFFFGAPNGYGWNEDAIRCAYLRRKILRTLFGVWFSREVIVSDAFSYSWNAKEGAWQLDTEFIAGRSPRLRHPFVRENAEVDYLAREILPAVQQRLREAGADGIVWQAGKGNPVALNNFLWREGEDGEGFAFIDLESGVPALFPLNPWALLVFYLPKAWKFRRPMFDDVDTGKMRRYLAGEEDLLQERLGEEGVGELAEWVDQLEEAQRDWKTMPRLERGIAYQQRKEELSEEEAEFYRQRPSRWVWREGRRAAKKGTRWAFIAVPGALWRRIRAIEFSAALAGAWNLIRSVDARADLARDYVGRRIDVWEDRDQLTEDHAAELRSAMEKNEATEHMGDFGAHIGLKASIQILEITVFSALFAAGLISGAFLAILILADGLLYRTSYTAYRCVQTARRLQKPPLLALGVGVIPLVGSLAFPAQMIWSAAGREDRVARFIVYDTITRIGTSLPIWGGEDTRTEHFFNRIADHLVRPRV